MPALIALLILAATWAQAQPLALLTDTDLKTAYCLKIRQSQYDYLNSMIGGEPQESPAYLKVQKVLREAYADLNRIRSYLLPRMQRLDPAGLIAAARRAETDWAELGNVAEVCTPRCRGLLQGARPSEKWSACLDSCRNEYPVVQRTDACKVVNWLPF